MDGLGQIYFTLKNICEKKTEIPKVLKRNTYTEHKTELKYEEKYK